MNIGIILAAGEGSRMGVKGASKTTIDFEGKPLIEYGVDLFDQVVEQIYIVVGA
jgi:molybdopterin-guanine dinucleotide biosynthesis protein A